MLGRIEHKSDFFIICGTKFLPPIIRILMNRFNEIHVEEPNEPPRDWDSQSPAAHFKSRTATTKTSPVVSDIIGRLNHYTIDNCDDEVHP